MSAQITCQIQDPNTSGNNMTVDPTHSAGRMQLRPADHAVQGGTQGGHYDIWAVSGATVSLSANAIVFSIVWSASAGMLFILKRLRAWGVVNATITTGVPMDLKAFRFSGASAAATGGTAVTIGSGNKSRISNMASSQVRDIRIASASAITAAASKTNDANAFGGGVLNLPSNTVAGSGSQALDLYKEDTNGKHPVVCNTNDGLEVQINTAGPTTGSFLYYFVMEWLEASSY